MTLTYGFYNSSSGDRVYDAIQLSSIFDGVIYDGVFETIGDKLIVSDSATPDLYVHVGTGRAWFDHTWTLNDAAIDIQIPTPDSLDDRIDVVYLEVDESNRVNSIDILEGTPADPPTVPSLTQTSTVHQYPLAEIYVTAQTTAVTQGDITNKVGTTDCPFVTGPLEFIDISDVITQWESQWQTWFEAIQDQLTEEAETNLQAQIYAIVGDTNPPVLDLLDVAAHDHDGTDTPNIDGSGIADYSISPTHLETEWKKIWVPVTACYFNGTWRLYNSHVVAVFPDDSSTAMLFGSYRRPDDWDADALPVYLSCVVMYKTITQSGNAYVQFKQIQIEAGEYIANGQEDTEYFAIPAPPVGDIPTTADVSDPLWVSDKINHFRFMRDHDHPSDTLSGDLEVIGFWVSYQAHGQ